ncbi:hypothetical protein BKA69DRAFT_785740 [Paraphysoderma sedebokerense]|nr:hypothetical protein BKA69DRAFT_785740 [Paraphysoderma sedebokerense]
MTTANFFNKSDYSSNDSQRQNQLYISAVTDRENNIARATSPTQFYEFRKNLRSYYIVFTPKNPGSDILEQLNLIMTPLMSIHRIPQSVLTSQKTSLSIYSNLFYNHLKSSKASATPWDTLCQSILDKVQNECKSYLRAPGPKTRWEVGKWDNDRPRGRNQDGDRQNKRKRDNKMNDKKKDAAKDKREQLLERQSRKDGKQKFSGRNHSVASGSQLDSDNPTPEKKIRHV